jgi:hypothetical protein
MKNSTKIFKAAYLILMLFSFTKIIAQPVLSWQQSYNDILNGTDKISKIATMANGDIIVCGNADGAGTGIDIVTKKYNKSGTLLWTRTFNDSIFSGNDIMNNMKIVASGIYIVGKTHQSTATYYDALLLKYDTAGNFLFKRTIYGTGDAEFKAVSIDINANIVCGGDAYTGTADLVDYLVNKYSSTGVPQWPSALVYHYLSGTRNDYLADIIVDGSGNIYATGEKVEPNYKSGMFNLKLSPTGNISSTGYLDQFYTPSASFGHYTTNRVSGKSIKLASNGDVIIAGISDTIQTTISPTYNVSYNTFIYNCSSSSLIQNWISYIGVYNNRDDYFTNLSVGGTDYYISGYSNVNSTGNSNYNIYTAKFNSSGLQQWQHVYAPTTNDDVSLAATLDNSATPSYYVTGYSINTSGNKDIITLKYNSNGALQWPLPFFQTPNTFDEVAQAIAIDSYNNLIVAGYGVTNNSEDFLLLKYCNSNPTLNVTSTPPNYTVCAGLNLTLTATGAQTYSWTPPVTNATPFIPPASGNYTVTGTDISGCFSSTTIPVTVNPQPIPSVIIQGGVTTFCVGNNVVLSGNVGGTWSNASTNPSITVTTSGTYSVTNTNACGSTTSNSIVVTVIPLPVAPTISASGSTNICAGSSIALSGNVGGTWSTGATTATISVNQAGTYYVTNSNTCGIDTSNYITTTITPLPTASIITAGGNATFCAGNNVILSGNIGGTWSNASTNSSITVTTSGTYTVTNTNACGSTTSNSIVVTVNPLPVAPTISASGSTNICAGSSITLSGNVGGTWSTGATTATISVNQAGTYYVTNSNTCGVDTSNYLTTTIAPLPTASTITAVGNTTFCAGNNVILNGNVGGTWSNASTAPSITVTTSGTYTVTNTNACGTATSNPITVTVNPLPTPSTISIVGGGSPAICFGQNITLGGNIGGTWNNNAVSPTIQVSQSGNYYVVNSNGCGSDTSNYIAVTINSLPTPIIIDSIYYLRVDSNIYNQYQWLLGGNIIASANSFTYTPLVNGIYSLIVTNVNGCSDTSNAINAVSVGLKELSESKFNIYPNPTRDLLNVNYTLSTNSKIQIQIINSIGQTIREISTQQPIGTYTTTFDTQQFANGIYFIRFIDGTNTKEAKVIIQ